MRQLLLQQQQQQSSLLVRTILARGGRIKAFQQQRRRCQQFGRRTFSSYHHHHHHHHPYSHGSPSHYSHPIHNENEISIFYKCQAPSLHENNQQPWQDTLSQLQTDYPGFAGILLLEDDIASATTTTNNNNIRNHVYLKELSESLRSLSSSSLSSSSSSSSSSSRDPQPQQPQQQQQPSFTLFAMAQQLDPTRAFYPTNVNVMFDFLKDESCTKLDDVYFHQHLDHVMTNNGVNPTSIRLTNRAIFHEDAVAVASDIVTIVNANQEEEETRGGGGGNYIWLIPSTTVYNNDNNDDDGNDRSSIMINQEDIIMAAATEKMIELCHELASFHDNVKSRLVIGTVYSQDQIEKCLRMGINKFAVSNKLEYEWIDEIVQLKDEKYFA